ncbi:aminotransferase [Blakeslea trispora]|nr:aminotransferase [Blakeslea trispora]
MTLSVNFSLLETILFEPDQGFYLLSQHLERLRGAIHDFQQLDSTLFPNPPSDQQLTEQLWEKVTERKKDYQRVRLLMDKDAHVTIESTLLPPLKQTDISANTLDGLAQSVPSVTVKLDSQAWDLSPNDPFILHKTTHRDIYEQARLRTQCNYHAAPKEPFDVVLYNMNHQITETSIANIAIGVPQKGGTGYDWKTPPVQSGLLPGVFRSYLIQQGWIREAEITVHDLIQANQQGDPIICFNSVRKAYRVQLLTE